MRDLYKKYFKTILDKILSIFGIIFAFPIMLIIAIFVRFFLGSPVLFKQQRPGFYGRPFVIYKFRTMKNANDENGYPLPDDKRLTKFGVFLRKYSLDELPELFNVLKGDMSLVGPRPLLMEYLPIYSKEQFRRHEAKPGVTGLAQISGRNSLRWNDKFKLDVQYVDNVTFCLDVKILCLTVYKVMCCLGISHENCSTMPAFSESDVVES